MTTIFTSTADDDVPIGIRRAAELIEAGGRRSTDRDPEQPRIPTWREIGALIALCSMIFTVGYNWRDLVTFHAEYDKHVIKNEEDHGKFMLRELSISQYQEIQRQLAEISRQLERADRKR